MHGGHKPALNHKPGKAVHQPGIERQHHQLGGVSGHRQQSRLWNQGRLQIEKLWNDGDKEQQSRRA